MMCRLGNHGKTVEIQDITPSPSMQKAMEQQRRRERKKSDGDKSRG